MGSGDTRRRVAGWASALALAGSLTGCGVGDRPAEPPAAHAGSHAAATGVPDDAEAGFTCCGSLLPAVAAASEPRGWLEAEGEHGGFQVRWHADPDPIVVNEPFLMDLQLELTTAGPAAALEQEDVQVFVHAWMPDHRHGMLRQPVATRSTDGSYRVRGSLFHMGGFWEVYVDVVRHGELERATFELNL